MPISLFRGLASSAPEIEVCEAEWAKEFWGFAPAAERIQMTPGYPEYAAALRSIVRFPLYGVSRQSEPMPSTFLHLSGATTSRLPMALDFEVYSGKDIVTIAVTVDAGDGMPTVVFVPLPKDCVAKLISAPGDALNRERKQTEECQP